jgi:predicted GIY-YIG superfamily endonuclease
MLVAVSEAGDRSEASKEEYRIKQLSREQKLQYILNNIKK